MTTSNSAVDAAVAAVGLVDHHVHGALRETPDRPTLEGLLTESDRPVPPWMTMFDSPLGLAIRRWCAPLLDLEPGAGAEEYVARRTALGEAEVTRRMLRHNGVGHYLVETGYAEGVLGPAEMAAAANADAGEIVRLESVFEALAAEVGAAAAVRTFPEVLAERAAAAAGLKSVVAYRFGFDFAPEPPTHAEAVAAAGSMLALAGPRGPRVADPTLLRFLLWRGVERGLPLQLHCGYGDPDLELHRCDPLLLTRFLRLVEPHGVDVLLLHCYPYHRQAGYLAQVFPHVYFDVGLAVNHTGLSSPAVVAESLELAPFAKILFSSDAYGPAELHHLGAHLWRRGLARVLAGWVEEGAASVEDAARITRMIGRENARRVYGLRPADE